ncbi:MAG: hypothetical protein AB8G14_02520 [Ilumatobacter sp.]
MRCHVCNVAVGDGQRFCHECGESLVGVTDPTEQHDVVAPAGQPSDEASTVEYTDDDDSDGAASGALLNSEMVAPPSQPEPDVAPPHRGALPDLAAPGTPGITPPPAHDDALLATEALGAVPAAGSRPVAGNPLDAIPYEPMVEAAAPPAYEPTATMPAVAPAGGAFNATDEIPVGAGAPFEATTQIPAGGQIAAGGLFDGGSDVEEYAPQSEGFRLRAAFVFAVLAMVATLMASVADVIDIRTTRPVDGIIVGIRALDDFGTNLAVAGFVGAALMLVGGLLSCFGLRWGAGVAGGAGLSMTGWAAVTLGLVEAPIHAAEGVTSNATEVSTFTLAITRDLGYFLIAAVGLLGLLVFVVSLRMAGTGGRSGLNPWIAAVGALAAVVLAAGPLITLSGAPLDANLGTVGIPREFFAGRLIQLGMIVVTGVIGFLSVRTYGLGLAAGGLGVAGWMWVSSLAEVGDRPVSVAVGNLGTLETTPHAVTTVGVTASIVLLAVAATMATLSRPRH